MPLGEGDYIEGGIDGAIVVRLPAWCSVQTAHDLRQSIRAEFPERQVIVTSDNVEFCKVDRLSPNEAAKILARVQETRSGSAENTSEGDEGPEPSEDRATVEKEGPGV